MDKEWIPIVGTLLGVLVGGGISSLSKWIELRHQRKAERNNLMRSKLEELYELTLEFQRTSFLYFTKVSDLAGNSVSNEQINELTHNLVVPVNKINTMISLYAPSSQQLLEDLSAAILALQHYGVSLLENNNNDYDKFRSIYSEVSDQAAKLLYETQNLSTSYTGIKPRKTINTQ